MFRFLFKWLIVCFLHSSCQLHAKANSECCLWEKWLSSLKSFILIQYLKMSSKEKPNQQKNSYVKIKCYPEQHRVKAGLTLWMEVVSDQFNFLVNKVNNHIDQDRNNNRYCLSIFQEGCCLSIYHLFIYSSTIYHISTYAFFQRHNLSSIHSFRSIGDVPWKIKCNPYCWLMIAIYTDCLQVFVRKKNYHLDWIPPHV